MTVVTMHRYIPIPAGVYNLKVLKYDQKESTKQRGQFYYSWTLQVLDALPEDYTGRDTFSILTPCELTEKNALRKFLNRVGFTEIAIDQDVDLDTLLNHKFVGKVDVKTSTTGVVGNDLVDVPLAEYDRFLERQRGGNQPPAIARAPLAARPHPAPAPAPVAASAAVPRAAQPAAMPTAARPVARPAPVRRPGLRLWLVRQPSRWQLVRLRSLRQRQRQRRLWTWILRWRTWRARSIRRMVRTDFPRTHNTQ
jgi:hypothetical protein